jgi:hypothetical protein
MEPDFDRTVDDVGNIVHLEHVNVRQPDQQMATVFYVLGLGLTRDPYMMVGVDNMWINIGRNQLHLPTGSPQRLRGTIGLVMPDLNALKERLSDAAPLLSGTLFSYAEGENFVDATCPWGNSFRCHPPSPELGRTQLGIAYVEFTVPAGAAARITRFYREVMSASAKDGVRGGSVASFVAAGGNRYLIFRETDERIQAYDGHHIQIYIADFSGPYRRLRERNLITRDRDPHEWRFEDIVDVDSNESIFAVEHEVRSLKHPLFARPLVNRNPVQSTGSYSPGRDAFPGSF